MSEAKYSKKHEWVIVEGDVGTLVLLSTLPIN